MHIAINMGYGEEAQFHICKIMPLRKKYNVELKWFNYIIIDNITDNANTCKNDGFAVTPLKSFGITYGHKNTATI